MWCDLTCGASPDMPQPHDHSFRKLLPGFVISAGTQVVLKVAKALGDGQQFKPPGSVGVVLESPPDNRPALLRHRFTDYAMVSTRLSAKVDRQAEPKRAKPMLYAYRVLMTGIHLLRTGEIEANLLRLNEHFGFKFLDELIARKVGGENTRSATWIGRSTRPGWRSWRPARSGIRRIDAAGGPGSEARSASSWWACGLGGNSTRVKVYFGMSEPDDHPATDSPEQLLSDATCAACAARDRGASTATRWRRPSACTTCPRVCVRRPTSAAARPRTNPWPCFGSE